jgi:hypothetical protein
MSPELNYLRKTGFLNARKVFFTKPGRHEVPTELESQLIERIRSARAVAEKIIVVYGGKFCYLNPSAPARTIDMIIDEQGDGIRKIDATHCIDMLADAEQRDNLAEGQKIFWLTPGWILYRTLVFQDWDKGKANENFPRHTGGAILLDAIGFFDDYSQKHPEEILEFSDWMGIPIRPQQVSLERLKTLLTACAVQSSEGTAPQLSGAPRSLDTHSFS